MTTRPTVYSLPRRTFLGLGALALAQGGLGFAAEEKASAPRFVLEWGKHGKQAGEFDFPIAITITPADDIFITDSKNQRVQQFTTEGKFVNQFPVSDSGSRIGGIAVDRDGNLYLACQNKHKIAVYTPQGKLVREIGKQGSGDGELYIPSDVAFAADWSFYVTDSGNSRVQHFSPDGKFLGKWGSYGKEPGQFGGHGQKRSGEAGPVTLAFDSHGHLYTTEIKSGRIQKLTTDGKFLLAWGDNEIGPGHFGGKFTGFKDRKSNLEGPVVLRVDKQDRVWISAVCSRVQQFTTEGKFVQGFGEVGTKPGQFYAPHGLAWDSQGHLYVTDAFNHRVQKFAL